MKNKRSGWSQPRVSLASSFKLGSGSTALHRVLHYFQLQNPCQHLQRSNLVLYSSGLVAGKRRQKKTYWTSQKCYRCHSCDRKTTRHSKKLSITLQTLTFFYFIKRKQIIYTIHTFCLWRWESRQTHHIAKDVSNNGR